MIGTARRPRGWRVFDVLWQVPAVLGSLLLSCLARGVCRLLLALRQRQVAKQAQPPRWVGLSQLLRRPLALAITQVMAPRWNCFAVLGVCDGIVSSGDTELCIEAPPEGWSFEIQRSDGWRRLLGPADGGSHGALRIVLEQGRYRLLARGYGITEDAAFPAVEVAGEKTIEACPATEERRRYAIFLETLRGRRSLWARSLHFHSYQLLSWRRSVARRWLPEPWLRRCYLPVAADDTAFFYGALHAGETLVSRIPDTLAKAHVSLVLFNRSSFPVVWRTLDPGTSRLGPISGPGTYLLRVAAHPRARQLAERVEVVVEGAEPWTALGPLDTTGSLSHRSSKGP